MLRINQEESITLGHLIDHEFQPGAFSETRIYRYHVTLVHVRRPDRFSSVTESVYCSACGEKVQLEIDSVGSVREARARRLSWGVAGLALPAAWCVYAELIRDPPIPLSSDLMALTLSLGAVIAIGAFSYGIVGGLRKDGVSLIGYHPHKLLR